MMTNLVSDYHHIIRTVFDTHQQQSNIHDWHIAVQNVDMADYDECVSWLNVLPKTYALPDYGWKIHLSATLDNADAILHACLPILIAQNVAFKLCADNNSLRLLNYNNSFASQAGKFVTIYPKNDVQAVELARALDMATQSFTALSILSDKQFKPNSIVHYRWGQFNTCYRQTVHGEIVPFIEISSREYHLDRRVPFYVAPKCAHDPFLAICEEDTANSILKLYQNRYLQVHLISRSLNGDIWLGYDIQSKQRCILKIAPRNALLDTSNRDMRDRLAHEANILHKLTGKIRVPHVYNLFDDEHERLILVMEDIPGKTLQDIILNSLCHVHWPSTQEVLQLALRLAVQMLVLHQNGVVHNDIKLNNIMQNVSGELIIIDYDIAYELNAHVPRFGGGTCGYSSPSIRAGSPPTPQDDIYSLGSVLYYYALNATPDKSGDVSVLSADKHLNHSPNLSIAAKAIILRALATSLTDRYDNCQQIIADCQDALSEQMPQYKSIYQSRSPSLDTLRESAKSCANRLGQYLWVHGFKQTKPGLGFAIELSNNVILDDLRGTAGSILAFSELAAHFPESHYAEWTSQLTAALSSHSSLAYNAIGGLYVGEAGKALALLKAGLTLKRNDIIEQACTHFIESQLIPLDSPDIFNGSAGRLKVALQFFVATKDKRFKVYADTIAKHLINTASQDSQGHVYWMNATRDSLPGRAVLQHEAQQLGYAHGLAGIADALLDYYIHTASEELYSCIASITDTLFAQMKPTSLGEYSVGWPLTLHGEMTAPFWCHGATGIGIYLLNVAKNRVYQAEQCWSILNKVAISVTLGCQGASPIYCHGLAGNMDFLVQLYRVTREPHLLNYIGYLQMAMTHWVEQLAYFPWGVGEISLPSLMTGLPGIILSCLHVAEIEGV